MGGGVPTLAGVPPRVWTNKQTNGCVKTVPSRRAVKMPDLANLTTLYNYGKTQISASMWLNKVKVFPLTVIILSTSVYMVGVGTHTRIMWIYYLLLRPLPSSGYSTYLSDSLQPRYSTRILPGRNGRPGWMLRYFNKTRPVQCYLPQIWIVVRATCLRR